jgi:hypothetical protein
MADVDNSCSFNPILRGKMTIPPRFCRLAPGHLFLFGPRGTRKTT